MTRSPGRIWFSGMCWSCAHCSWLVRGIGLPACSHACEVSPEQSKTSGPAPPHTYGLPSWASAKATAARPASDGVRSPWPSTPEASRASWASSAFAFSTCSSSERCAPVSEETSCSTAARSAATLALAASCWVTRVCEVPSASSFCFRSTPSASRSEVSLARNSFCERLAVASSSAMVTASYGSLESSSSA